MSKGDVTCGVEGHDDSCLCDVVIPMVTPWVDDAIQDMWMGQEIVNLMGFTQEWDDDSILDYFEKLVYAKDHWDRNLLEVCDASATSVASVKREIKRRLQSSDSPSIMGVAKELGLTHDDLMRVLFANQRYMSEETLQQFECDVVQRKFTSAYTLGKKYGMKLRPTRRLHSYWGVKFAEPAVEKPRPKVLDAVDDLIKANVLSNREIVKHIFDEFKVELNIDKVRARRYYLNVRTVNAKG